MRYGYFLMPMHPPGSFPADTLEMDLRQIERLEQLGYEEAWIGEHFTAEWENIPSPEIFIAAALQRTSRIKLATGVSCLPNHNPFHLAHRIAQLDHMARGRFLFGIGSGGFIGDFELVDIDPRSGRQRQVTVDVIDTVLKLWEDPQPGKYAKDDWKFVVPEPDPEIAKHVWSRPFQKPHPPIAVAGVSERSDTLILAGERGWIPMSINMVPLRVLKTHWQGVEEGAKRTGRTPSRREWRVARTIHVAETTERARREAIEGAIGRDFGRYFIPMMKKTGRINGLKTDPAMPDEAITLEYLADNVWIVGDPDDVARQIRGLYEEVGGFGAVLALAADWGDEKIWDRSMTLLAREVMPKLADLTGEPEPAGARAG
jgi:alkanesulfonate monooxygenase SsuD/methylene tetrahydromethanopterin reductase-like flavin-dependent oxidoreductase (luciferase family)